MFVRDIPHLNLEVDRTFKRCFGISLNLLMNTVKRSNKFKVLRMSRPFQSILFLVLLVWSFMGCKSIETPINRKFTSNKQYKEVLFVTDKMPNARRQRNYYWYKSREVHYSQDNYGGELLDGEYVKYYYSNQLAERGGFKNGLKKGEWTKWYENGQVAQVSQWKKGRQMGKFISRDSLGNIVEYGKYKKDVKIGNWVYPEKGETIYFIKGKQLVQDPTLTDSLTKLPFLKRIFNKRYRQIKKRNKERKGADSEGLLRPVSNKKDKTREANGKDIVKKRDTAKSGFFKKIFKRNKKETAKKNDKKRQLSQKEREELVRSKQATKEAGNGSKKISINKTNTSKKLGEELKDKQKTGLLNRIFGKEKRKKKK